MKINNKKFKAIFKPLFIEENRTSKALGKTHFEYSSGLVPQKELFDAVMVHTNVHNKIYIAVRDLYEECI